MRIHLVRDVLDNQLVDVRQQNAGKVDGIVLEVEEGAPPRVLYVEVSPVTAARRLHRRLGAWMARLDARLGEGRGGPFRIPISRIALETPSLHLDFDAEHTPIFAFERWLRRTIIGRIPGA